jgi:hypothetical protein
MDLIILVLRKKILIINILVGVCVAHLFGFSVLCFVYSRPVSCMFNVASVS